MTYTQRDLRYNNWHKEKLPTSCFALDIDLIEFRAGRGPVAVTEIKNENEIIKPWQNNILREISERMGIPAYLIIHKDLIFFKVINLKTNETRIFGEDEYIEFVKNL